MRRHQCVLGFAVAAAVIALPLGAQAAATQPPVSPPATAGAAATPQRGGGGGGALKSPEVGADRRVTFRLRSPNAVQVQVSLPGKRLPMQKDAQGVWTATSDTLAPDYYPYSFIVDGATMNDPANRQVQTSFGSFQTMFVVPGPQPWLPAAGVPRGAITRHTFHSAVANDDRDFYVYTPPGYDARRGRAYPVLYLLHGLGDDAERWMTGGGGANVILDNLITQGKAVPMVMVATLGYGVSNGPTGARTPENITGYTKILLDEVMPMVDKAYNVGKKREERAIAGLSMGGAEALYTGLNHVDTFAWVASFSGAFVMWPNPAPPVAPAGGTTAGAATSTAAAGGGRGGSQAVDTATFAKTFPGLNAKAGSRLKMLWIVCGTSDGLIGVNRQFKDWLTSRNVAFTEQEVPNMAHVWPLWRQNVADMVPRLFRN